MSEGALGKALDITVEQKAAFLQRAKLLEEKASISIAKILEDLRSETLAELPSEQRLKADAILDKSFLFNEYMPKRTRK